jgi:hypothetical protein
MHWPRNTGTRFSPPCRSPRVRIWFAVFGYAAPVEEPNRNIHALLLFILGVDIGQRFASIQYKCREKLEYGIWSYTIKNSTSNSRSQSGNHRQHLPLATEISTHEEFGMERR